MLIFWNFPKEWFYWNTKHIVIIKKPARHYIDGDVGMSTQVFILKKEKAEILLAQPEWKFFLKENSLIVTPPNIECILCSLPSVAATGPITEISQSKCFIAGLIFYEYWTGCTFSIVVV